MCGLCGVCIGHQAKRRIQDIDALADTFTRMLLLSEHRGPHATGVAWVKRDGSMQVAKEPLPACEFVQTDAFLDWLNGVDRQVTYLMGHTRWPSRGSVRNPHNNHPLVLPIVDSILEAGNSACADSNDTCIGQVALTHNGTISDHAHHLARMGLPRTTQVDSELLARIAQRHADEHGIDVEAFLADLAPLDGSMSVSLVATTRPDEIILLKGNMPLEVRVHPRRRVLLYASEAHILDRVIGEEAGWKPLPLAYGEGLVVNTQAWTMQRLSFTFAGLQTAAGQGYTGTTTRKDRQR